MDSLTSAVFFISDIVSLDSIVELYGSNALSYIFPLALFICALSLVSVFSKYRFLSFKILIAWVIACFISLMVIPSGNLDSVQLVSSVNSWVILSSCSSVILFIFYILNLFSGKAKHKKKNFGYNGLWIGALGFVVTCAFCCFFNIALFVAWRLFY